MLTPLWCGRFMGLGAKREIYSGYEPSWRYAHAASIWIKGMEDEGLSLSHWRY